MIHVVIIWIFVDYIFNLSSHAVASLEIALFELILSHIYLWLIFSFTKKTLCFDYLAANNYCILCLRAKDNSTHFMTINHFHCLITIISNFNCTEFKKKKKKKKKGGNIRLF